MRCDATAIPVKRWFSQRDHPATRSDEAIAADRERRRAAWAEMRAEAAQITTDLRGLLARVEARLAAHGVDTTTEPNDTTEDNEP